jgi:hypothetical protein
MAYGMHVKVQLRFYVNQALLWIDVGESRNCSTTETLSNGLWHAPKSLIWALRKPGFIAETKIAMTWQPFMEVTVFNFSSICDMVYGIHGKAS